MAIGARAGWAAATALSAAALGCGQQAPQDLSYVLVELDQVGGGKGPGDALVVVDSPVAASNKLCIKLVDQGAGTPASFVLFRKFGADPKPRATLTVTSYSSLQNDMVASPGSEFDCPGTLPATSFAPDQTLTFDFCAEEAVKVSVDVGSKCSGCDPMTEVCGAGLGPDGNPCPPGKCCASAIADACALVRVPTTMTTPP